MPASNYPSASGQTTPTTLDTNTATRLRVAFARLNRRLGPTEAATQAGLTPTRISVLLHLARSGPTKLSTLAEAEGINPTMLSRIIGKLSDDGLLARSSDIGDRRAAWVELTAKGEKLVQRMRRERTDALNVALSRLDPDERHRLEDALEALEHLAEVLKR